MSRDDPRGTGLSFKQLEKQRTSRADRLKKSKNPFLSVTPQTDHSIYRDLYKFDIKTQLSQYNLPFGAEQQKKEKFKDSLSKISRSKDGGSKLYDLNEVEDGEFPDQSFEENQIREENVNYTKIVKGLYNQASRPPVNKIQNALFIQKQVADVLATIKTGNDAISFFAKYGNTTPIKFISCVQIIDPENFRPYDLEVITKSQNQKQLILNEYYTISAHGIVHVYTDKFKKQHKLQGRQDPTSTEVISLSDWMHQSSLFNIITNIQFFKSYAITKLFNIWKANVRYRCFCKTRKKLVYDALIAKPAFAEHLVSLNRSLYDLQNNKTIAKISDNTAWDKQGFNTDMNLARMTSAKAYQNIVNDQMVAVVKNVCNRVVDKCNMKQNDDQAETRFGQQVKQKPMNQIRLQAQQRAYLLSVANKDKQKLRNFIRLVDYLAIETLVNINQASVKILLEQMRKQRKTGIFKICINQQTMTFMPDQKQIIQLVQYTLSNMIDVVKSVPRVITQFREYFKLSHVDQSGQNMADIQEIIIRSVEYIAMKQEMQEKISKDFTICQKFVEDNYKKVRQIVAFMGEFVLPDWEKDTITFDQIKQKIKLFNDWNTQIKNKIKDVAKGTLNINGSKVATKLTQYLESKLDIYKKQLIALMLKKMQYTKQTMQTYIKTLENEPNYLKEYSDYIQHYQNVVGDNKNLQNQKNEIQNMQNQLKRLEGSVKPDHVQQLELLKSQYIKLQNNIKDADESIKNKRTDMINLIQKQMTNMSKVVKMQEGNLFKDKLTDETCSPPDAIKQLNDMRKNIDRLKDKNDFFTKVQKLMELSTTPNKQLMDLEAKFADRNLLWTHVDKLQKCHEQWYKANIRTLDSQDIQKQMQSLQSTIMSLKLRISNLSKDGKDKVLDVHEAKVKKVTALMPIISALANRDLKDKHWKKIFEKLDQQLQANKPITLTELLIYGVQQKKDVIEQISARASGQKGIQNQIQQILKKWQQLNFIVLPYREYKDKFIMGTVEDVMQALDDHQLKIQSMLGSRYVGQIRQNVEIWEKKLLLISEVIDEWLSCQRQWMYLQNIFTAQDIQKQLPQETTKFIMVDKFWKDVMGKTNKRPLVIDCCANEQLLRKFQKNNKELEDIQKCLQNYLQTKRAAFPRFYFLSNDELLEILSQTRNPHAVQAHLRKCFDNMNKIQFTDAEDSRQIVAMISAEPQTLPQKVKFTSSVTAQGPVQNWLMSLQQMMIKTLYDISKQALKQYPDDNPLNRKSWLFSYPAQCVLVIDLIKWTDGVTKAIIQQSNGNPKGLDNFYTFMKQLITRMVAIVRQDLNILERTLMGALIVLDVHARDVVLQLAEKRVSNLNDFEFSKQLRYYWETDVDDCVARQTNTRFIYGYQYLGNGPRLVITPLTDKCYMTLTGAKHLQYGGAPAGPAGTGKTETTKDLAKALAVQCVVFNCSDGLDYKTMGRFFSGLAQGGAWACFDEFNRIDIEVLSVIAQQILTIQVAIKREDKQFDFEGRIIPLNTRFGVFITMNPGYAGRTQLPDNLKALFRPVAMMIPDYALIAEIMLFAEGFETAKILARKMVQLYKLSSQQLSKQDHYDFGMRAVKSVLVMAGALRRRQNTLSQDVVLIRAMRDSNVPKFLQHDLPLFMGIISDLFPNLQIPNVDYGNLQKAIQNQLQIKHYQKPKKFITKIIQLMQTIMVRHGVMVVGHTGTGKTTVINTLAFACEQLNKQGSTDYYHKVVKQQRLNPKSVTMNQLFGYTNILTNEWTDGIVADIVRNNVADTSDTKKWIIFDGPVDALWIENMNTVLDDNKMLCLSNGQRIKLPASFTMMFEVNDLAVASPATVSRCGMVYMQPIHLGWQPILDTWSYNFKLQKSKETGVPAYVNNVIEKMRMLFKQNLTFLRQQCKQVIGTADNNLVQSCINLFNVLFDEMSDIQNLDKMSNFDADMACSMVLIFSFIWSAGANLHDNPKDNSRVRFSQYIKGKILKFFSGFPYQGQVYDYFIDFEKKEFHPWTELVKQFKYVETMPYFSILVPTADTVKYKYILQKLVIGKKNCLISGETGVGKSVIVGQFVATLTLQKYSYTSFNFSAQTSTKNILDVFMDKDKFTKKTRYDIGPLGGKKMVLFVDDINMPALQKYGAQPPNQLLRQIIDQGGFYELKKFSFMKVSDCVFVAACAPPGGGRNQVTPRLFRHFNTIWAPDLSTKSMETIFTAILRGFLSYTKGLQKFSPSIVKSSVQIYGKIRTQLLPTPAKSHYTFNLRDLSKVFQGILQIKYDNLPNKEVLISLWIHECSRIFYDRLVDQKDREWFLNLIQGYVKNNFQFQWQPNDLKQILFGDYSNMAKEYQKIDDIEALPKRFTQYLGKHNSQSPGKAMNLVFFKDAIMHLSRICRILKQNRGNALLIGVGGSGRQSLTRLASSIRDFKTISIEITKNYKDPQWKQDLKNLLKTAGKGEQVTFLFSDTQIVKQSFLEDLNNILNTGQVPNMWAPEDYEQILGEMRPIAIRDKIIDTRQSLMKLFVQLTRQNLHIVLAFSPVGEKLRNRCRQFPSIINCCTIDWFDKWPNEALYSVAERQYKSQQQLGITDYIDKLSALSVQIHSTVRDYSQKFYSELRRKNYVTPTSYLELLKLYIEKMTQQQNILPGKIKKYTVGLQTLKQTNIEVNSLQQKIIEMQPKLQQYAKETAIMVVDLEQQSKIASEAQSLCLKDTQAAQKSRDQVNQLKNICQIDLDKAIPILNKAKNAVASIDKKGLQETKSFLSPPPLVEMTLKAVCLVFGEKQTWDDAKRKILGQMDLITPFKDFKAATLKQNTVRRLRQVYLSDPNFDPDKIEKVSLACRPLGQWVIAVEALYRVQKEVQPKKKKLAEAEGTLKKVEGQLNVKQKALKQIQDKVAGLQRNYEQTLRKSESLKQQQQIAAIQLVRAEKLVGGLAGQAQRWKINVAKLEQDMKNLVGNVLLASASIAYIGPFTYEYRNQMVKDWARRCKSHQIPVSSDYMLSRILAEQVKIRQWQQKGLPTDNLSTDNGIFIFNCRRWPLIIDPQGQANKWIKSMQSKNQIQITKLTQSNFLKILQNSIKNGQPVLMQNIQQQLDPSLQPLLNKQIIKKGPQWTLRLGDQDIPYSWDFKFYMTTKLPNPHYIPEICIKTTIINFTVTPSGLEDQLLAQVVRYERIELETKRVELILQISQDKKQLQDLEDKILIQISESQGRILEDESLIQTLDTAKITSETVNQRIEQSKVTSQEIDRARQEYRSIAKRGSVIYFVISDLSSIDPMYQYSLEFFIKLFKKRLESTTKSQILAERISILIDDITQSFYTNICRGLFEKDKLLFSFMIASKIQLADNRIAPKQWNFFLRGSIGQLQASLEQCPSFLSDKVYKQCAHLQGTSITFKQLLSEFKNTDNTALWQKIMQSQNPSQEQLPNKLQVQLDHFQKLLLAKILRQEKLILSIKNFVKNTLGELFIQSPVFDLKGSFEDSSSTTPIIFILSPGADPIAYLIALAKEKQMDTRLKMLSLGQGQGQIARQMILSGRRNGDWVCLQNCHLAVSWMTTLQRIQETQGYSETHSQYRLWLTSMPSNKFPVPVLQNGIKITNQPPKGLKANLMRTYTEVTETSYNSCKKPHQFKKLLFSLAFFHAVILQRRKYGAIGWNIAYQWMNSDFETSQLQLKMYLDQQPDVPYKTLNYLIAEINYGGRVTDDKDVRLITALLEKYLNPDIMQSKYSFSSSGIYYSPMSLQLLQVKQYITTLPLEDDPQIYGLHRNANITFQQKNVKEFFETLLSVQPRTSSDKAGQSPDELGDKIAKQIESKLPQLLPVRKIDNPTSLDIFKAQEVDRFNILLKSMKKTLVDLQKAIKGTVVMSIELENMLNSFLNKKVPQNWEKYAYPSLKPLATWTTDLIQRIAFFRKWVEKGSMQSYWVSAFFFPQGFMTSAMQSYARKTMIPIDTLVFKTQVRKFTKDNIESVPGQGVNIHGLFIQGCKINYQTGFLQESDKKTLFVQMPVIWLRPVQIQKLKQSTQQSFECPLYKTSTRKGTLSTTGHSTNFVMFMQLKTQQNPKHWIRRGVALLCQLDQ